MVVLPLSVTPYQTDTCARAVSILGMLLSVHGPTACVWLSVNGSAWAKRSVFFLPYVPAINMSLLSDLSSCLPSPSFLACSCSGLLFPEEKMLLLIQPEEKAINTGSRTKSVSGKL